MGLQVETAGHVKQESTHAQKRSQAHLGAVGDLVEASRGLDQALQTRTLLAVSLGQRHELAQKLDAQAAPLGRSQLAQGR